MVLASAVCVSAFVIPVDAQEVIADGTYDVNFLTYKTGTKETSGMVNRFEQPAKLIVENGEATIQLHIINQNSLLGKISIPYKGTTVDMTTLEGTSDTATRLVSLPIEYFNKSKTVTVEVVFPGSATPVTQTFDLVVQSPIAEQLTEEVAITAYKHNTVEKSLMQQFMAPTAKIVLHDDHAKVQITFTNKDYITALTIDGAPATIVSEENSAVTYMASVKSTKQLLTAEMDIFANGQVMKQQAHLHLAVKGAPIMISNPFSDITGTENEAAILTLLNKEIIMPAAKFNPNHSLTRSQFALMIARTLKLETATDAGFNDLAGIKATDVTRYNAINALASAGIVKKQGQFKPNDAITRQQVALMIYRAMQYHVGTDALDFGNNIGVYADYTAITNEEAQRAFTFLYVSNAMTGSVDQFGQRIINPNAALTRGQMAKILNGTLKYLGH